MQVERPGWAPEAEVRPEMAFFYTSAITEKQFDGTVSPEKGLHSEPKLLCLDRGSFWCIITSYQKSQWRFRAPRVSPDKERPSSVVGSGNQGVPRTSHVLWPGQDAKRSNFGLKFGIWVGFRSILPKLSDSAKHVKSDWPTMCTLTKTANVPCC